MKKRFLKILVLSIGVFLLAGCHKMEATTKVNPDGSGELRMGVGFSAEERANLEKQNANSQDFCNTSQNNPNITVTQEQRGDETWCISTTRFKDLQELHALYGEKEGIKVNRLEIKDGRFYYDIDLDTLSEDSSLALLTDIQWSLELPGAPIEHNASQADGNTLTWSPTPKSGIINLHAESEAPQSGFPLCSSAFLGLAVVFVHWQRRGREYTSH